jgi:hypothetical protein
MDGTIGPAGDGHPGRSDPIGPSGILSSGAAMVPSSTVRDGSSTLAPA